MRYIIIALFAATAACANPLYLAVRDEPGGVVIESGTSNPVPPPGMRLIPWTDMDRIDLRPRPGRHPRVHPYRLVGSTVERRPDADVDAEGLALRQQDARQEVRALRAQRREAVQAVQAGDAQQSEVDALDAKITAKIAEIQGMR